MQTEYNEKNLEPDSNAIEDENLKDNPITEDEQKDNPITEDEQKENPTITEDKQNQDISNTNNIEINLTNILTEIKQLKTILNSKIEKDALADKMYSQLKLYENNLLDKLVNGMALEIMHFIDSININLKYYDENDNSQENYIKLLKTFKQIPSDLEDILYRQEYEAFNVDGDEVDVKKQKIMGYVKTDVKEKHNKIAERIANGYLKSGKVIKVEQIKIYEYDKNTKND